MAYPEILSHRMPFDIDGTEVGTNTYGGQAPTGAFNLGFSTWLTSLQKQDLNNELWDTQWHRNVGNTGRSFFWFFPEIREITHIGFVLGDWASTWTRGLQRSLDSTNGLDGTWEDAVWTWQQPTGSPPAPADWWRGRITPVSFSGPAKVLRIAFCNEGMNKGCVVYGVHLYGYKYAGQQPDDIVFCDAVSGTELSALMDWGDQPEGTTEISAFKVKNASTGKIANNINLQLNHEDFTISWSADGPWSVTLDIAQLGVGALSNTVYVRNALGPPLLTLGPKAARVIATVGSWT